MSVDPTTGHITGLRLIGPSFDDSFIERTSTLTRLERLTLQQTKVTKNGLSRLTALPSLKFLTITCTPQFGVDDLASTLADIPSLHHVEIAHWGAAKEQSARLAAAVPKVKWRWAPFPVTLVPESVQ